MAALCGPANAANVTGAHGRVEVDDAGKEGNRLAITVREAGEDSVIVIRERGVSALAAAGDCQNRDSQVVVCRGGFTPAVYVDAGPGDDNVSIRDPGIALVGLDGGLGADRLMLLHGSGSLAGGPGSDTLIGATGRDKLFGGPGRDRLRGGSGSDRLRGDAAALAGPGGVYSDSLDGGPGRDLARWGGRGGRPVVVDLSGSRPSGARGERDRLHSIEDAVGSAGADRLIGDGRANHLYGNGGGDLLIGRGGPDRLNAGTASPRRNGGPDRQRDRFRCGKGTDVIEEPALDPLPRDCERLSYFGSLSEDHEAQPRAVGANRYAFLANCPGFRERCRRRVALLVGGRVLARSLTVRTRRARARVVVRLRRALPESGPLEVRITGEDHYEFRYRLLL